MLKKVELVSIKLAIISQARLSKLIKIEQSLDNWEVEFELHEYIAEQHREKLDELDKRRDIEAIIAGGGNAAMIEAMKLQTPLVKIQISGFDVMQALWQAQHLAKKAVFINYIEPIAQLERYASIFNIEVEQFTFNSVSQAFDTVLSVVSNKDTVIIGASHVCDIAESMQAKSVFIYSQDAIDQALRSAQQLALSLHGERIRREKLEAILHSVHDGIIYIDADAKVEEFNPAAENILGLKSSDVISQPIAKVIPNSGLENVFLSEKSQYNQLLNVGDTQILSNRIAVFNQGELIGAVASFQDVKSVQKAERSLRLKSYDKGLIAKHSLGNFIGETPKIKKILALCRHFANTEASILIQGETGTGKELIAQGIHLASQRASGPFVAINCASIPETLLESTLFGYDEGAFTGAHKGGKSGLFELANQGTIFLDEIGELPFSLQGRLLRVLQEKQIMRLGSDTLLNINVRVIAATNRNLIDMIASQHFKEDLYYRLNVLNLTLPSLRERIEDIPLFIAHFFKRHNVAVNRYSGLVVDAMSLILNYPWPGNIRELENLVERMAIMLNAEMERDDIEEELHKSVGNSSTIDSQREITPMTIQQSELHHLQAVLIDTNNNHTLAAKKLGISRSTLWRKLKNAKVG
jgi:propionate catabolism operon transcriptional regulator